MSLQEALVWLVSGGGAGIIAYAIMGLAVFADMNPDRKRYATIGVCAALAVLAYVIQVFAGFEPMPVAFLGWTSALFSVIYTALSAFFSSQVVHAARVLAKKAA